MSEPAARKSASDAEARAAFTFVIVFLGALSLFGFSGGYTALGAAGIGLLLSGAALFFKIRFAGALAAASTFAFFALRVAEFLHEPKGSRDLADIVTLAFTGLLFLGALGLCASPPSRSRT